MEELPRATNQSTDQRLNSLLQWGLAHADHASLPRDPVESREHVAFLNKVLSSQVSEADRMKAAILIINDQDSDLEDRLAAWDELEMLVESLDNANDLKAMRLWPDIVKHLDSSEPEVVVQCLWVIGTAVQNNPISQTEFLSLKSLPRVISLVSNPGTTGEVRSKALYCLGGAIKHNEQAVEEFSNNAGWQALDSALKDPIIACRRKAAFLIDSLFQNTEQPRRLLEQARSTSNVISTLVTSMTPNVLPFGENGDKTHDIDLTEKAANAIFGIATRVGADAFKPEEKDQVLKVLNSDQPLGFTAGERGQFVSLLQ